MGDVTILTATWHRPEVFEVFCEAMVDLGEIVVVDSERSCYDVAKRYDVTYIEAPNQPLYEKWNAGALACERIGSEYVLMMGSDDIMSEATVMFYNSIMADGVDFLGITDCYFLDLPTQRALYWSGYRMDYNRGKTAGIGRALSRHAMDMLGWRPWASGFDTVLDTGMDVQLDQMRITRQTFSVRDYGLMALDIKSDVNMTPFAQWDNTRMIDRDVILSHFPTNVTDMLMR